MALTAIDCDTLLVFGGLDSTDSSLSDVWRLIRAESAWKEVKYEPVASGRVWHTAFLNPHYGQLTVVGGDKSLTERHS